MRDWIFLPAQIADAVRSYEGDFRLLSNRACKALLRV